MEEKKNHKINVKLWKNIALIAGIFSFVMCILIIATYIQLNRHDPVNTELINTLVERLNENPKDQALRNEIRELDLLVRKAYFTNQWQIKMGGYLLLISVAIFVIAFQVIEYFKKIDPEIPKESTFDILQSNLKARKWIGIAGGFIVAATVVIAFSTQHQLKHKFTVQHETKKGNNSPGMSDEKKSLAEQTDVIGDQSSKTEGQEMITIEKVQEDEPLSPKKTDEPSMAQNIEEQNLEEKTSENSKTKNVVPKTKFPSQEEMKQNFPAFRGYNGNGIAFQKNVPTTWDAASGKNLLWKTAIPLHGYNSPVIWEEKVFITGANVSTREIYCFDITTGEIVWTAKADAIDGSPEKSPKVTDDTGHAAPTAATDGRRIYAIFSNGDLVALDMEGNRVWAKNLGLPENHYGHSSSLMLHEDLLIIQYDQRKSQRVMALQTETGDEVWNTSRNVKISWASPVVVKNGPNTEVILAADPGVQSYNVKTGQQLWTQQCIYGEVGPSVAYENGVVFASNEYASLVAIDIVNEPKILWESYDYLSDVPSPIAKDGLLYLPTSYGVIACFDGKTGKIIWEQEFDYGFYGSPMLVEDKIYIIDRNGNTKVFSTGQTFELIASNPLGESSVSTPAFADGKIIIRGDKHLYCFGE